jgi:hypothetical protein
MNKVFLGGTCNDSLWRNELIPLLNCTYFNPVIPNWNDEAYKQELLERETCKYCLYVITPNMTGVYSIVEVIDDSNKRPEKTLFCILDTDINGEFNVIQMKSLLAVQKMVVNNGGKYFNSLKEIANFLNSN